jgi:hypothetical protein
MTQINCCYKTRKRHIYLISLCEKNIKKNMMEYIIDPVEGFLRMQI